MAPATLAEIMSPAQKQGWLVPLRLAKVFPAGWCLVGGQMVWLLAAEHGTDPPRAGTTGQIYRAPRSPRRSR